MYTYKMRKILVIMICFLVTFAFSSLHINAYTIKGGISYTVSTARQIAFENVNYKIDISKYNQFLNDSNFTENKTLLSKNKYKIKDRKLVEFSDGSYSITYKKNNNMSFFYNKGGSLTSIQFDLFKKDSITRYSYDIKGNLESVILCAKNNEQFIFSLNKKLIAHWKGNNCYNEKGELIMTREAK